MSICGFCNREMQTAASCIPAGPAIPARMALYVKDKDGRCHDCGVLPNGLHHPNCDWETCPYCEGQRLTCDCGDWRVAA